MELKSSSSNSNFYLGFSIPGGHQIILIYKISSIYISYKMFERLQIYQIFVTYANILNESDLLSWIVVNWQYLSWNVMNNNELSDIVKKNHELTRHVMTCPKLSWIYMNPYRKYFQYSSWSVMDCHEFVMSSQ